MGSLQKTRDRQTLPLPAPPPLALRQADVAVSPRLGMTALPLHPPRPLAILIGEPANPNHLKSSRNPPWT